LGTPFLGIFIALSQVKAIIFIIDIQYVVFLMPIFISFVMNELKYMSPILIYRRLRKF